MADKLPFVGFRASAAGLRGGSPVVEILHYDPRFVGTKPSGASPTVAMRVYGWRATTKDMRLAEAAVLAIMALIGLQAAYGAEVDYSELEPFVPASAFHKLTVGRAS